MGYRHAVWGQPKGSDKIAAFDLDGCVITTKSEAKFPKDATDWKWWNGAVLPKIRQVHADG